MGRRFCAVRERERLRETIGSSDFAVPTLVLENNEPRNTRCAGVRTEKRRSNGGHRYFYESIALERKGIREGDLTRNWQRNTRNRTIGLELNRDRILVGE